MDYRISSLFKNIAVSEGPMAKLIFSSENKEGS